MTRFNLSKLVLCTTLLIGQTGCGDETAEKTAENRQEAPATQAARGDKADSLNVALCSAHGAPENLCFICDASLREAGRLWCVEHSRYEDRCFICHPDQRDAKRLYCEEHGLYEDECFLCHPELRTSRESSPDLGAATELMCDEHGVAEAECGICHPDLASGLAVGEGLKIRFASPSSAARAGVGAEKPKSAGEPLFLNAVGELGFNLNRLARITSPVDGVVRDVHSDVGESVSSGRALVSISSPRVAEVRSDLLRAAAEETLAAQVVAREEDLFKEKVSSAQELADARARHASARATLQASRQTLLDLGFKEGDLESLTQENHASVLLLRVPFAGTVVERDAVTGDVVEAGDELFVVADLGHMWLDLAVSERDAARLSVGMPIQVVVESLDREFTGRLTWISTKLDETTRMARVRADIPNGERVLKAGMFVTARIPVTDARSSLVVDRDAVCEIAGRSYVFVRLAEDLFELRSVDVQPATIDHVAVLGGLRPDEDVVMTHSYLVKSEFQKSRLGAGCVD